MDNKIAELAEQISIMKRQLTKAINSGNEAKALKLIKIKEELDKDFEELLQQVAIAEERERKAEGATAAAAGGAAEIPGVARGAIG